MDNEMQSRMDSIVEDEIRRGYRVLEVPADLRSQMTAEHEINTAVPTITKFRFLKLTPRRRSDIARAVVTRYHADLQDKGILSNEQLRTLNIARGEWSIEEDKKLEELQERSNRLMRELTLTGFDPREEWAKALGDAASKLLEDFANPATTGGRRPVPVELQQEAKSRVQRWLDYRNENLDEYTKLYATELGLDIYNPDKDYVWINDRAPSLETIELIRAVDELRDKLDRYLTLLEVREKLYTLQGKRAKIFAESVESRRDQAEEMGRVYFCAEVLDETGKGAGKLTPTFEGMWELPEDMIQWLLVEAYFFFSNVPLETREFLEQWGFVRAPRRSGSADSPVALPAEPNFKADSTPLAATPASSSVSPTPMSLGTVS